MCSKRPTNWWTRWTGAIPQRVREECGDLLLEVVFMAQIAFEEGRFGMAEVAGGHHGKNWSAATRMCSGTGNPPAAPARRLRAGKP